MSIKNIEFFCDPYEGMETPLSPLMDLPLFWCHLNFETMNL